MTRGLVLLSLNLGGSVLMIAGMVLIFLPLVAHIRGWKGPWRDARYEFSPGEQGTVERRRVRRAQLRAVAIMLLGMGAHGLVVVLRRTWFG